MRLTCSNFRGTGSGLAIGVGIASALAAATHVPFSTYFGIVALAMVLPQLLACLRRIRWGNR